MECFDKKKGKNMYNFHPSMQLDEYKTYNEKFFFDRNLYDNDKLGKT